MNIVVRATQFTVTDPHIHSSDQLTKQVQL
jgi:hypothetical protein